LRRHCPPSQCRPAASQAPLLAAAACLGLLALPATVTPAAATTIEEQLGSGMPLVLKDGRIANVTVYTVPFATGSDSVDAETATSLEATFRPLATDCFLTAQAIGHVAPGVARDGETLAAHRLARARADGIQALLAGFGMPQPAVASVWDWQFLVQESQVTLWVFSLAVGDDCDGSPLPLGGATVAAVSGSPTEGTSPAAEAASMVAVDSAPIAATPPADPAESTAGPPADPAGFAGGAAAPGEIAPRSLTVADQAPEVPATEPINAKPGEPVGHEATNLAQPTDETAGRPAARVPDPLATAAVAPAQPARAAPTSADSAGGQALEAAATQLAAVGAGTIPPSGQNGAPALVITFDVNSSYFPAGAGRQLRAFLDSLPKATAVELELATAVGTGDVRGVSGEEAKRYNAWMAERRAQRVAEWLEENAGDRAVIITERLVENDPSREVRLFTGVAR
jgi:hypothetical protein